MLIHLKGGFFTGFSSFLTGKEWLIGSTHCNFPQRVLLTSLPLRNVCIATPFLHTETGSGKECVHMYVIHYTDKLFNSLYFYFSYSPL